MKGSRPRMRSSSPRLGEMTIKVPAPFAGISDLGFTAQYRAQQFNEPQRDIPFLRDCAMIAHLRLSEVIEMRVSAEQKSVAELSMPLQDIVRPNGERLLWGLSA